MDKYWHVDWIKQLVPSLRMHTFISSSCLSVTWIEITADFMSQSAFQGHIAWHCTLDFQAGHQHVELLSFKYMFLWGKEENNDINSISCH